MNITTHDSEITKDEVLSLICLLDEEYRSFDLEVHVYGTYEIAKEHLTKTLTGHCPQEVIEGYLQEILDGRSLAGHLASTDAGFVDFIAVYEFNVEKEHQKIQIASLLFHEFRHAFQKNRLELHVFLSLSVGDIVDSVPYRERALEVDANFFSASIVNLHATEIDDILGTHNTFWCVNSMSKGEMEAFKRTQEQFPELYRERVVVRVS